MWSKITSYVWCCKKDELMILYLLLADLSYYLILKSWQLISERFLCLCSFNSILHINSLAILLADMALNHLSVLRPLLCESLVRHARCPLTVASRVRVRPSLCPGSSQNPSAAAACIRLYATKKAKGQWRQHWNWSFYTDANVYTSLIFSSFFIQAKAKGQSVKLNINSALVEEIISLDEVKEDMNAVLTVLKDEFTRSLSIRTSPGSDHLKHFIFFSFKC